MQIYLCLLSCGEEIGVWKKLMLLQQVVLLQKAECKNALEVVHEWYEALDLLSDGVSLMNVKVGDERGAAFDD